MRRNRLTAVVTLVVAFALGLTADGASADALPKGAVWHEAFFRSTDGTQLHADVFRPEGAARSRRRTPVLLLVSPYLGLPNLEDPGSSPPRIRPYYRLFYDRAIEHGYSIVQVSLRGTGESGGCGDFGGSGERGDVRASVRWAMGRGWSNGRVGMFGHSYDGLTTMIGVSEGLPLAGAVVIAPAVDQYRAVYMNGVPYLQGRAIAAYYQSFSVIPARLPTAPAPLFEATDGRVVCAPQVIAAQQIDDPQDPFWQRRNLISQLAGARVPILWVHGFLDGRDDYSGVRPDNFLAVWRRLRGPHRAWFGQWPHVVPGQSGSFAPQPLGRGGFLAEELRWLDRYVKGLPETRAAVGRDPKIEIQDGTGRWRAESTWPPADARYVTFGVLGGAYADAPGNKAEGSPPGEDCLAYSARAEPVARCNPASANGRGSWSFTQPARDPVRLAGNPKLVVDVSAAVPNTNLVSILYDVSPTGQATMISRAAALVRNSGRFHIALYPQDWLLRRGHRFGLLLTGSDDAYFLPDHTMTTAQVTHGRLELPLLRCYPGSRLDGDPSRAVRTRTSFAIAQSTITSRTVPASSPPGLRTCGRASSPDESDDDDRERDDDDRASEAP